MGGTVIVDVPLSSVSNLFRMSVLSSVPSSRSPVSVALNTWVPWSVYNPAAPYKSSVKGIGPGEDRLGAILGTTPLGQNRPYDLDLFLEGVETRRADVKQLDSAKSFLTGRNGRDALRPFKASLTTLLSSLPVLLKSEYIPSAIKKLAEKLVDKSPDEFCESALKNLMTLCIELRKIRLEILERSAQFVLFDPMTGESTRASPSTYYATLGAYGIPAETLRTKMGIEYEYAKLLAEHLSHPFIVEPCQIKQRSDDLAKVCAEYALIFVDEKKGFYIMTEPDTKIQFNRITKGHPRFRIDI